MVINESDEMLVTILCLCGQQFAYNVVEHTIGICNHHFADLFVGLFAFEAGVTWP